MGRIQQPLGIQKKIKKRSTFDSKNDRDPQIHQILEQLVAVKPPKSKKRSTLYSKTMKILVFASVHPDPTQTHQSPKKYQFSGGLVKDCKFEWSEGCWCVAVN